MNGWIGQTIVGRKCSMSKANLHKLESVYANDVSKVNRIKTDGDPTWIYVKDFEIYLDNSPYAVVNRKLFYNAVIVDVTTNTKKKGSKEMLKAISGNFEKITMLGFDY